MLAAVPRTGQQGTAGDLGGSFWGERPGLCMVNLKFFVFFFGFALRAFFPLGCIAVAVP